MKDCDHPDWARIALLSGESWCGFCGKQVTVAGESPFDALNKNNGEME